MLMPLKYQYVFGSFTLNLWSRHSACNNGSPMTIGMCKSMHMALIWQKKKKYSRRPSTISNPQSGIQAHLSTCCAMGFLCYGNRKLLAYNEQPVIFSQDEIIIKHGNVLSIAFLVSRNLICIQCISLWTICKWINSCGTTSARFTHNRICVGAIAISRNNHYHVLLLQIRALQTVIYKCLEQSC